MCVSVVRIRGVEARVLTDSFELSTYVAVERDGSETTEIGYRTCEGGEAMKWRALYADVAQRQE